MVKEASFFTGIDRLSLSEDRCLVCYLSVHGGSLPIIRFTKLHTLTIGWLQDGWPHRKVLLVELTTTIILDGLGIASRDFLGGTRVLNIYYLHSIHGCG